MHYTGVDCEAAESADKGNIANMQGAPCPHPKVPYRCVPMEILTA